jgi:hypothetical protein
MPDTVTYSRAERFWLGILAAFGFAALNGVFVYEAIVRPETIGSTLANPLALVFVIEALVLVGVLAYLLKKWGVSHVHWAWFVVLSLLGSMAFALPVALLWPRRPD